MFPGSEFFTALVMSIPLFGGVEISRGCFNIHTRFEWVRNGSFGLGTALQAGRSQVRLQMILIDLILPAALRPWGRLSL
jgi:hypothetical protein